MNTFEIMVGYANIISAIFGLVSVVLSIYIIYQASKNNFFQLFKNLMEDKLAESGHIRKMKELKQIEESKENERKYKLEIKKIDLGVMVEAKDPEKHIDNYDFSNRKILIKNLPKY